MEIIMDRQGNNFIITIPSEVFFMLNATQTRVYLAIRSFAENGRGVCFAPGQAIANRAKVSRPTVYKTIDRLKKLGYIKGVGKKFMSVGGKPVEHLVIIDNLPVSKKQILTNRQQIPSATEELVSGINLPVRQIRNISKTNPGTHKAESKTIYTRFRKVRDRDSQSHGNNKTNFQAQSNLLLSYFYKKFGVRQTCIPKQKAAIKKIFSAGYSLEDVCWAIDRMSKDSFWKDKGFDFMTIAGQLPKLKMADKPKSDLPPGYRTIKLKKGTNHVGI